MSATLDNGIKAMLGQSNNSPVKAGDAILDNDGDSGRVIATRGRKWAQVELTSGPCKGKTLWCMRRNIHKVNQ